nr:heterokaryon incompatibility protein 6, or allele [Quercus suber]
MVARRRVVENRPIWIDAICINQDDVHERSQQVRQIDRIYQSSEQLFIWLGDVDDVEEEWFLARLKGICATYSATTELDPTDWERNRLLGRETRFTEDDRHAMLRLLKRPWFKRRWVIQEAYYKRSERRRICIGDFIFLGTHFDRALFEMRLLHRAPALDPVQSTDLPHRAVLGSEGLCLRFEMYFSFATAHVSIILLISATTRAACRAGDLASLPSWVPDWRQPVRYRSRFHELAVSAFLQDENHHGNPHVRLHPNNPSLSLVDGRLLHPCPRAKFCQDFRCACITCRFSRAAIRSADGVPVVAELTDDAEDDTSPPRVLFLINGCSIGFWLERQASLRTETRTEDEAAPQASYRSTTSVALPQYADHRAFLHHASRRARRNHPPRLTTMTGLGPCCT